MKVSLERICLVLLRENCLWPLCVGSCDLLGWCFNVRDKVTLAWAAGETQSLGSAPLAFPTAASLWHTALGKPAVSPSRSLSALSPEMGFAVTAISRTPGVTYSDSFDLQCIIKPHYPARVPVSVTWRFQPVGTLEFHDLVTFTRDGGVQWGDRSSSFRTRTAIEKAESSNNVRLSISRASDTEAGKYQCVAELWRRNYNNTWTRLAERTSNLLEIRVLQPGQGLGGGCRGCLPLGASHAGREGVHIEPSAGLLSRPSFVGGEISNLQVAARLPFAGLTGQWLTSYCICFLLWLVRVIGFEPFEGQW